MDRKGGDKGEEKVSFIQQTLLIDTFETWEDANAGHHYRIDSSVLPLLFLGLLVFQLDRMNLASALTDGFAKDIGVDQSTINLGNQLMFMGIVVFEIPCNMLLQRVSTIPSPPRLSSPTYLSSLSQFGPRKWISLQIVCFGIVATLQVLLKNRTGFLVSRLILGLAEAGYIPGAVYTLSTWYKKRELAKRVAIFFFGMFGGNAISPILASGILQLGGKRGIKGWQWLFMSKKDPSQDVGVCGLHGNICS